MTTDRKNAVAASEAKAKDLLERLRAILLLQGTSESSLMSAMAKECLPAFPCSEEGGQHSSLLQAVMLCKALELQADSQELQKYVWRVAQEADIANLASVTMDLDSIAIPVLALTRRFCLDTRMDYMLLAKTIAQAQMLGLHIEPRSWNIPVEEQNVRRSLWWCLFVHDTWTSFLTSRPSHIQHENYSTLRPDELANCNLPGKHHSPYNFEPSQNAFPLLCQVTMLVSRLQRRLAVLARLTSDRRHENLKLCNELDEALALLCHDAEACTYTQDRPPGMGKFSGVKKPPVLH